MFEGYPAGDETNQEQLWELEQSAEPYIICEGCLGEQSRK